MTEKARLHDLELREDVTIDGDVPQAKLIKLGGLGQCTLKQAFIVGPMCGQELGVFAGTAHWCASAGAAIRCLEVCTLHG